LKLSKKLRRRLRAAWLAGLGLLVAGSLLPGSSPAISWLSGVNDKLLHFLAYAFLTLLAVLAANDRRAVLRSVLIMFALGIALDYAQRFIPSRAFELGDILADTLGLLCGAFCGVRLLH
jgi:VanZ family protein